MSHQDAVQASRSGTEIRGRLPCLPKPRSLSLNSMRPLRPIWMGRGALRCAVLRTKPEDDVLDPLAHTLGRFGAWFARNRRDFDALDASAARTLRTAPCMTRSARSAFMSFGGSGADRRTR